MEGLPGRGGVFLACYWLPVGRHASTPRSSRRFHLARWYAREHVLLCLVPAFFIAGAIGLFVSQACGHPLPRAAARTRSWPTAWPPAPGHPRRLLVHGAAALRRDLPRGAGLGPATAFLYSGPAINVLAIILTARVLGLELGLARAVGAIVFSVVIGLLMHSSSGASASDAAEMPIDADRRRRDPLAGRDLLRVHGGHPRLRQLGRAGGHGGVWSAILASRWLDHRRLRARARRASSSPGSASPGGRWRWPPVARARVSFPDARCPFRSAGLRGCRSSPAPHGELGTGSVLLGLRQADPAAAPRSACWSAGALSAVPGTKGSIPRAWVADAVGGNSSGQPLRLGRGRVHVLRHPDRGPHPSGADREAAWARARPWPCCWPGRRSVLPNMLVIRSVIGTQKDLAYVSLVGRHGDRQRTPLWRAVRIGGEPMKTIQVLGTGCPKCKKLAENAECRENPRHRVRAGEGHRHQRDRAPRGDDDPGPRDRRELKSTRQGALHREISGSCSSRESRTRHHDVTPPETEGAGPGRTRRLAILVAAFSCSRPRSSSRPGSRSDRCEPDRGRDGPVPRLVDLGSDKCIPCKRWLPSWTISPRSTGARFIVEFIDVWKDPDAGRPYDIRVIPTQVFFDADGKERFRHEGFMAKNAILAKWTELGIELRSGSADQEP